MSPTLFLTQLLPLLVFIVVDSFVTDVRVSILCAVLFAVGQLAVTWARTRRVDWFVVLDVALIGALGGVSIALDDEFFFKLKPAIVEAVTVVFMVVLALAPDRLLLGYYGRMVPGMASQPEAVGAMKRMLGWMCGYVLLHAGAVLYTALYSTKEIWAFVSGPGFYVFFLPVLAVLGGRALLARRGARRNPAPAPAPGPAPGPGPSSASTPGAEPAAPPPAV